MRKTKEENKRLNRELFAELLSVIIRIIGGSVQDKLLKAVLIGVISVVGVYYDLPDTTQIDIHPAAVATK